LKTFSTPKKLTDIFVCSIASFYDTTIPFLYKNIFLVNDEAISLTWLNQARVQFLKAFRSIAYSYVESVINNS